MKNVFATAGGQELWKIVVDDLVRIHPDLSSPVKDQKAIYFEAVPSLKGGEILCEVVENFFRLSQKISGFARLSDRRRLTPTRIFRAGRLTSHRAYDWGKFNDHFWPIVFMDSAESLQIPIQISACLYQTLSVARSRLEKRISSFEDWGNSLAGNFNLAQNIKSRLRRLSHEAKERMEVMELNSPHISSCEPNLSSFSLLSKNEITEQLLISIRHILMTGSSTNGNLRGILSPDCIQTVSPGFLYQRWCCLQVAKFLVSEGYNCDLNPVDWVKCLLFSGVMRFNRSDTEISMYLEPLLRAGKASDFEFGVESFSKRGQESFCPDIVLVMKHPVDGASGVVLDPTLRIDIGEINLKNKIEKYKDSIFFKTFLLGHRCRKKIERSVAVIPDIDQLSGLLDPYGSTLFISMYPGQSNYSSLKQLLKL